jgi:hypothetical protein
MFDGWMGSSKPRLGWVVIGAPGVLALVAIGVPLVSLLYVGVFLLCPLIMAGMHGGHGQSRGHEGPWRAARRGVGATISGDPGAPRRGGPDVTWMLARQRMTRTSARSSSNAYRVDQILGGAPRTRPDDQQTSRSSGRGFTAGEP